MKVWRPALLLVCICAFICLGGRTAAALNPQRAVAQYSLTQWGHRDGLSSTAIYAIAQTRDGFLWLGTADGLVRFDGLRFAQVPVSGIGDAALGRVQALALSADGALWVGTESGILLRMDHQAMKSMALKAPISSIREQSDSSIDVETSNEVFRISSVTMQITATCPLQVPATGSERGQSGSISQGEAAECGWRPASGIAPSVLNRAHLTPDQIRSTMRDSDGNLWIATRESGVFRVSPGEAYPEIEQLSVADGLSSDSIWNIFEDREHNLWVGTQNGLNRLRDDKFSTFTRRTGLLSDNIDALAAAGNEVFAGSTLGLSRVSPVGAEALLRDRILSLSPAAEGSLLAATPHGLAVITDARPQFVQLGIPANHITALTQSSTGDLWFYDQLEGLYRWHAGHAAVKVTMPGLANKGVSVMQADSRGNVWLGFATGEIVLFDGATFHTFSAADNLPGGAPNSISVDRDGTAWIASERGLARYSGGRFASWSRKNGLPGNRVLWAARDAGGHVWLGYTIGVASVANEDLSRAAADPRFIVPHKFYDDGDGLRSNPDRHGSSPVAVTPDGRIWFTTSEGLATIDPAHIHKNLVPPLAGILEVKADDVDQDITRPIKLAPRTHRIEIKYTGLSLSDARKVTFRYQLLNFDSDWQQAGTLRSATYTNLPPGEYRFQVLAANGDGVWSVTPATLMFTLPPAVYQTKLFIAACVVALLLTAILLVRMRVRATADRLRERFEERLDERARVAQDLHDNLLQDVMGISLQLEIADELTPAGTAGKPMLTRALQLSESALAEGRGALTTLRLTTLAAQDVLQAVLVVAEPFTQDRRKAIRCSVEGTEIPLRAGIGEEIVQIAREALRNALRHTQGPVDVQLRYARNSFTLVVTDVGTGMSPAILKSGVAEHFGLTGMRERAARIAATLTIDSTESGTRVRLSIPARMAYSGSDGAEGMWARFKTRWAGTKDRAVGLKNDE